METPSCRSACLFRACHRETTVGTPDVAALREPLKCFLDGVRRANVQEIRARPDPGRRNLCDPVVHSIEGV